MTDVVQRVRTVFSADGSGLRREASTLASQFQRLQRLAIGLAGSYGLARIARGLIEVNASAEGSALGIATMIQAADRMRGRMTPFSSALGAAKETLEGLRQVAVDTPATFEQVAQSFRSIVMPARAAGMDMAKIAQLASDIATADISEGGTGLIARDIAQMLRGRNDADSAFLRPYAQEIMKQVRAGNQVGALNVIQRAVQIDPQARKAFGDSFEGRAATFKDQVDAIKRAAGAPLFAAANEQLGKISEWLTRNKVEVERVAKAVGDGLVRALAAVKDAIVWLVESGVGKWILAIYAGTKAVGLLGGAFRMLIPVLGGLAASPLWAVIAGAAAAVAFIIKGIQGWQDFTQQKALAESNRSNFGRVGGLFASLGNATALFWSGNARGAGEMVQQSVNAAAPTSAEWDRQQARAKELEAARQRSIAAADASDRRRRAGDEILSAATKKAAVSKALVNVDARGSKITLNTRLETDDPARFADASVKSAFIGAVARPLSATFGLGAPSLATGAR